LFFLTNNGLTLLFPFLNKRIKPTIASYELKYGSKVIYGKDYLKKIPDFKPEDIQATLTELTATTIADSIKNGRNETSYDECFVCGGGIHNQLLMERLQIHLPDLAIHTTHKQGIDPDWLEAIAFAWLAKQTIEGKPSNLPSATGAKGLRVLGAIYHK